jgi:hypothetical protein
MLRHSQCDDGPIKRQLSRMVMQITRKGASAFSEKFHMPKDEGPPWFQYQVEVPPERLSIDNSISSESPTSMMDALDGQIGTRR